MASPGCWTPTSRLAATLETLRVGTVVLAAGWKPYDATKLVKLGYGLSKDVITNIEMEEMAKAGKIVRPSDGKAPESVAFIQCAGSRDPEHLPYCSDFCCTASLKQALYVRESNPNAIAYILYKDIRTPGQTELFYKQVQSDPGVMLTKAEIAEVGLGDGGKLRISATDTLLGANVIFEADLVVLATGMVPATADEAVLNLGYRQGPNLPDLELFQRLRRLQLHLLPVRNPADRHFCRRLRPPAHEHGHGHGGWRRRRLQGHSGRGARRRRAWRCLPGPGT